MKLMMMMIKTKRKRTIYMMMKMVRYLETENIGTLSKLYHYLCLNYLRTLFMLRVMLFVTKIEFTNCTKIEMSGDDFYGRY